MHFVNMATITDQPFHRWLKSRRREKDLTQGALGLLVGIDQSGISRLENGVGNLEVEVVAALGEALGDVDGALAAAKRSAEGSRGEIERTPNEEELQRQLMAYTGDNPVLSAAKGAAVAVAGAMRRAGAPLTGEEPDEVIVRGRRKGITVIDE
jgi:transcriptional regulator with XRE-family HTH domain